MLAKVAHDLQVGDRGVEGVERHPHVIGDRGDALRDLCMASQSGQGQHEELQVGPPAELEVVVLWFWRGKPAPLKGDSAQLEVHETECALQDGGIG